MQLFASLFAELDQTNKTNEKVEALAAYFRQADADSAAWGLYFLSGQKLQRLIPSSLLRQWAVQSAGIEMWLFEECYEAVGDLAETISLIVPKPSSAEKSTALEAMSLAGWVDERLLPLKQLTVLEQREAIVSYWRQLDQVSCLVLNKLLTGSFRVGVSLKLVTRGLSLASGIATEVLTHRLMGTWSPTSGFYRSLLDADSTDAQLSRPYPFFLASPLEAQPETLGSIDEWQAEWKWDGIRAQVIRRSGETFIWSRGEELLHDRFPELTATAAHLPDGTVLDGEIVAYRDGQILPFAQLQRRIGRKQLGKRILTEVPAAFLMFDLLEWQGIDLRDRPLYQRRQQLQQLFSNLPNQDAVQVRQRALDVDDASHSLQSNDSDLPFVLGEHSGSFQLPPTITAANWSELADWRSKSRDQHAEGLMLKRLSSPYQVGRTRGSWWKWKIEPYTIDAVLLYAQRGHGKRASLYTDYTFGVWDGDSLVPFAKAYSGLTDQEISRVDRFVRQHTIDRFGPVRSVKPELVFELAFENIQLSPRHKSGIAVRFPRITRWRNDKTMRDADSLQTIHAMLKAQIVLESLEQTDSDHQVEIEAGE